jgi:hypothetical protein
MKDRNKKRLARVILVIIFASSLIIFWNAFPLLFYLMASVVILSLVLTLCIDVLTDGGLGSPIKPSDYLPRDIKERVEELTNKQNEKRN